MANGQYITSLSNKTDKYKSIRWIAAYANGQRQKEIAVQFLSEESGLFSDVSARKEEGYKEEML